MKNVKKFYSHHKKALVAVASSLVVSITAVTSDNHVTATEWKMIGWSAVTAFLVYFVKNETGEDPTPVADEEATSDDRDAYFG